MPRHAHHRLSLVLLIPWMLGLAACSPGPSNPFPQQATGAHPNVARAFSLPVQGIDVSRYQGKIDWASVKASGTRFAYIKATEGGDHLDERFVENWQGARAARVPRGAYHFVFWCRDAAEQVDWFRRNVPREPNALAPVLDLEWNGSSRSCPQKVPRATALAMIKIMLDGMEAHTGRRPLIYTDPGFYKDVLEGEFEDYPLWVRSVAAEPEVRYAGRPWVLWQYTATGRVNGVSGAVDRNAFNGGPTEWAQFLSAGCSSDSRVTLANCKETNVAIAE